MDMTYQDYDRIVANLKEDVRGLTQKLGEVTLRLRRAA